MKKTAKTTFLMMVIFGLGLVGTMPAVGINLGDLNKLKDAKKIIDTAKDIQKASKPWTYAEERMNGRVVAARAAASFGGISRNRAWNDYVNKIGRALVPYCKRPKIKYRFAILNSDQINAFSCPGGYIFVTKGLLKKVDNEAELAGVLAHEIAHASQKHIEKEIKKQKLTGIAMNVGVEVAASQGKIDSTQANLIRQLGDASWDVLISKGLSKQDEYESDRIGTENIQALGYNPFGVASFLKNLMPMENQKGASMKILLSTHPKPSKRIEELNKFISSRSWSAAGKPELRDRFQAFKKSNPI